MRLRLFRRRARGEALACQELVELVTDYLEDMLTPDLRQVFEDHISQCGNCSEYLRQMRRTIELEQQIGVPPAGRSGGTDASTARMLDVLLAEFRARHQR